MSGEIGWYARLMDAQLTEDEFQRWQRLLNDGLTAETALAVLLRGRESPSKDTEPC